MTRFLLRIIPPRSLLSPTPSTPILNRRTCVGCRGSMGKRAGGRRTGAGAGVGEEPGREDLAVKDKGLGTEAPPSRPARSLSPAPGGSTPARARRTFPGSELRRCPSAGLGSGGDLERPLAAPLLPRSAPALRQSHAQPQHFLRARGCQRAI